MCEDIETGNLPFFPPFSFHAAGDTRCTSISSVECAAGSGQIAGYEFGRFLRHCGRWADKDRGEWRLLRHLRRGWRKLNTAFRSNAKDTFQIF